MALVGLLTGFVLWRIKLIGKRKAEVAEETLMAFPSTAVFSRDGRRPQHCS